MLDFSAHPFIAIYVLLLLISGIGMVVLSVMGSGGQSVGWRIFGGLAGLAFLGYGVYLGFFFTGGEYIISFKAIILPFALLAGIIGKARAGRAPDAAAPQLYLPHQQQQSGVQVPGMPYAAQPQVGQPLHGQQPYGQMSQGPYGGLPQYQPVQAPAPAQPYDAAPPPPQAPQDLQA